MSSDVTLDTLQIKQMLDDFVEAKRGGIGGMMVYRFVNQCNRSIWYIDEINLYGYAMMQKLSYKVFEYTTITLDEGGLRFSVY